MDEDLEHVIRLELLLLEPDIRSDPERLVEHLHPAWFEFGASGRVWDIGTVAEATAGTERILATQIQARRLGPDAVLVTYRSADGDRHAFRSSTWVRENGRWLMVFHQGTLTEPA